MGEGIHGKTRGGLDMSDEVVTEIKIDTLDGFMGTGYNKPVFSIGGVAYESIDPRVERGFLARFVDKQGNKSKVIRLAPIEKLPKG
jgi:hypothetical protein